MQKLSRNLISNTVQTHRLDTYLEMNSIISALLEGEAL